MGGALTIASLAGLALAWLLKDLLILTFGAIVFAIALGGLAKMLNRHLHLPQRFAVVAGVLLVLGVLAGLAWFIGDALADQFDNLREQLPKAWQAAKDWLAQVPLGRNVLEFVHDALDGGLSGAKLASYAGLTLGAFGSALLVLVLAVYFAADPFSYRAGAVRLLPKAQRKRVDEALEASGDGLSRWLLGQGVSMLFLGVTTAIGLALLGMPLALALGVLTGVFAFVPFFGSVTAGVLAVLLAFVEGPRAALHVALLFIAIQQVEEYLLAPLVQRWAVALPPVLTLLASLLFGVLFGPLGVVFGTPLMVVLKILVERLWIEEEVEKKVTTSRR